MLMSVVSQIMPRVLRGLDEMTKWTLALCPGPGVDLVRMAWGWSQSLEGVKVIVSGELNLISGMSLPVPRQMCLRYPVLPLQSLPNYDLCWPCAFPSCRYRTLDFLLNLFGLRQLCRTTSSHTSSSLSFSAPIYSLSGIQYWWTTCLSTSRETQFTFNSKLESLEWLCELFPKLFH